MNIESTEVVWLTVKEAKQAIREFVNSKGFKVTSYAQVHGLGDHSEAKELINVQVAHNIHEVKS